MSPLLPNSRHSGASLILNVVLAGVAVMVIALAAVFYIASKRTSEVTEAPLESAKAGPSSLTDQADPIAPEGLVCGRCHVLPPTGILPTERWPKIIERMQLLTGQYALGTPLTERELAAASNYYKAHSPAAIPELEPQYAPSPLAFAPVRFGAPAAQQSEGGKPPVIGNVSIVDLDQDERPDVLVSDIQLNALTWIHYQEERWIERAIAAVSAPARTEVVDVDGDGHLDIVVADLGGMQPTEDPIGKVVLLRNDGNQIFTPEVILSDVARVPDVRPADLDGDGDVDFLVAAFGLYKTGRIGWLEHREEDEFSFHTIYRRNGISHVPTADLNGDGAVDFVALISQEHEEVIAFINRGNAQFDSQVLFKGPHPMFGSSNIRLVDLDQDQDTDVVFTNGDALDIDTHPKPWHGVQWLENRGELNFIYHDIVRFPGAYSAATGDLDNDGDLDIVATSMLNNWEQPERQSIIWLENDGNQNFLPHALGASPTFLVTVDVGDLDDNGWLDVVAGSMYVFPPYFRVGRVTAWVGGVNPP